jgi:transcriptional regulator GlxA family with amidase domain
MERLDIPARRLRDLSLEAIAEAANLSTFRFARGFRQALRHAPQRFRAACRS